jgi:hypothetical protein
LFTLYLIDTPEQWSYSLFINSKEGMTMDFDLSQYIPFNAFVAIGIIWMLAFIGMTSGSNSEGE